MKQYCFNPLNTKLNPICHLQALLGADHILHISRIRVKNKKRMKMWYESNSMFIKAGES